jgi:hypothetical protein
MFSPHYNVTKGQVVEFLDKILKEAAAKPDAEQMTDNTGVILAAVKGMLSDVPDDCPLMDINRMLRKCGVVWE